MRPAKAHARDHEIIDLLTQEQIEHIGVDGELDVPDPRLLGYDSHPRLAGEGDEARHEVYERIDGWSSSSLLDLTLFQQPNGANDFPEGGPARLHLVLQSKMTILLPSVDE